MQPSEHIRMGTGDFWRVAIALVSAAFCTFALIYCVQPLLPVLAEAFHVSPAVSSLSLSVTTVALAFGMVLAGLISESLDRKSLIGGSLVAAALLSMAAAFAPNWHSLLLLRALTGLALCGVPAVCMAYVSEEIDPASGGFAMGLYVGGTGLGGMSGRLLAGVLCDFFSWRGAIGVMGGLALLASILFWTLLPPSRHFTRRSPKLSDFAAALHEHFQDGGLRLLFLMGFLLMGGFVSIFNYIEFRVVKPPYNLSQTTAGMLFTVYVIGMFSSAWAGRLAGQRGPRAVLWSMVAVMITGIAVTLAHPLWAVVAGVALVTFGFFGGHAIVSAWVPLRARRAKALASSLYLFAYYMGSSIVGTFTGKFWSWEGWIGVAAAIGTLLVIALAVSLHLQRLPKMQGPRLATAAECSGSVWLSS